MVDTINYFLTTMSHAANGVAVLDLLHHLSFAAHASLRTRLEGEGLALAPLDVAALTFLQENPGCSQADFVQFLGRDKAQVTRLVKLLVERALVVAIADGADRRLNRLWLTEAGKAAQRQAARQRFLLAEAMMGGFDERKRERVARLLREMAVALGAPPGPVE